MFCFVFLGHTRLRLNPSKCNDRKDVMDLNGPGINILISQKKKEWFIPNRLCSLSLIHLLQRSFCWLILLVEQNLFSQFKITMNVLRPYAICNIVGCLFSAFIIMFPAALLIINSLVLNVTYGLDGRKYYVFFFDIAFITVDLSTMTFVNPT